MEYRDLGYDKNGNRRIAVHFLALNSDGELNATPWIPVEEKYRLALIRARKIGGKKYHTKGFGGGIVFQAHNIESLERDICRLLGKPYRQEGPAITQLAFAEEDHDMAERMARKLGYTQTAYTSTSALWGLYCLPDRPGHRGGCIVMTKEFGLIFVQDKEDIGL